MWNPSSVTPHILRQVLRERKFFKCESVNFIPKADFFKSQNLLEISRSLLCSQRVFWVSYMRGTGKLKRKELIKMVTGFVCPTPYAKCSGTAENVQIISDAYWFKKIQSRVSLFTFSFAVSVIYLCFMIIKFMQLPWTKNPRGLPRNNEMFGHQR